MHGRYGRQKARMHERGGGTEFDPRDLFNRYGAAGCLFDQRSLDPVQNRMWEEAAKSTQVDAVDDPVGYIESFDPNTNDASQSTDASRPILAQTAGGVWYVTVDGSADHWVGTVTQNTSMTIAACFRGSAATQVAIGANPSRSDLGLNSSGQLGGQVADDQWTTINSGGADRSGADIVGVLTFNGTTVRLFEDYGVAPVYDAAQSGAVSTSLALYIGARNGGGTPAIHLNGRVYAAFIMRAAITKNEAVQLARWLGKGVV